ncbi:MAG: hypothetical protein ACUVRO_11115 [Armatimonadota bacterium]
MLVVLVFLLVFSLLFLAYREWFHSREMARLEAMHAEERRELLNRLMARNLGEYVQAEVASRIGVPYVGNSGEETLEAGV